MAGWFDTHAKNSATRTKVESVAPGGVSRRRVIIGGSAAAAATAAAWTAPALMASAAAAVGLSTCPAANIKVCTDGSQTCCPNTTDTCNIVNGQQVCSAPATPGGFCGNCGQGTCPDAYKCNGNPGQANNAERTNVCGGEGAQCCANKPGVAGCFGDGLVCVAPETPSVAGTAFCRKECDTNADCRTGGVKPGNENCPLAPGPQVCSSAGYCADACIRDGDCSGNATCAQPSTGGQKVCGYNVDGNLTATCAAGNG